MYVLHAACGVNGALYALISCVTCCPCCYSCFYRAKMRQQYLLRETPCGDCLVHCCCEYCSLCQEYRELKSRGYDLAMGKDIILHKTITRMCFLDLVWVSWLTIWCFCLLAWNCLGWHGNVEKKNRSVEMASVPPTVEEGMSR
jgi:hypothetical protein